MKKALLVLALLFGLAAVSVADGADPMPLCRGKDSHGNPCQVR